MGGVDLLTMTHWQRVRYFRKHPPTVGSNATEYQRGLKGYGRMSARGSVGHSANSAGLLNRDLFPKGPDKAE